MIYFSIFIKFPTPYPSTNGVTEWVAYADQNPLWLHLSIARLQRGGGKWGVCGARANTSIRRPIGHTATDQDGPIGLPQTAIELTAHLLRILGTRWHFMDVNHWHLMMRLPTQPIQRSVQSNCRKTFDWGTFAALAAIRDDSRWAILLRGWLLNKKHVFH